MKKLHAAAAALALSAARTAVAAGGDTGTGAVGEMQVSGTTFALLVGALVALGLVIWVVIKIASK